MSVLTLKLVDDHKAMLNALNQLKTMGINHPDSIKTITSIKSALIAHLKNEEVNLYPKLYKASETDTSIKSILNVLSSDMDKISHNALAFFDKYSKPGNEADFSKDIIKVMTEIGMRVRREEEKLYPLYDKIAA